MKKFLTFILLISSLTFAIPINAQEQVKIGNIWYELCKSSNDYYAYVIKPQNGDFYTGNVSIPERLTYNSKSYTLVGYKEDAFRNQANMTSLAINYSYLSAIPNSTSPIYSHFEGCLLLESLNITENAPLERHESFGGCVYLRYYGGKSYKWCLKIVPPAISGIFEANHSGDIPPYAFSINDKISSIKLNYDQILSPGFGKYRNIEGFSIVYHPLYSAKDGVLYSKSGRSIVQHPGKAIDMFTIPASVDSIRSLAFAGCAIGNLTVPKKVFISPDAFDDFNGKITFEDYIPYDVIRQMAKTDALQTCTIRVHGKDLSEVKKYWSGKTEPIESFWINYEKPYYDSYKFTITAAESNLLKNLDRVTVGGKFVEPNIDGVYEITDLFPGDTYEVCIYYTNEHNEECIEKYEITTKEPKFCKISDYSKGSEGEYQLAFAVTDESEKIILKEMMGKYEFGIKVCAPYDIYPDKYFKADYKEVDDYAIINITGLFPGVYYNCYPYIRIGERYYHQKYYNNNFYYFSINTESITPVADYKATPTTIMIKGIVKEYGTFKADRVVIYDRYTDKEYKVKGYKITGLRPNEEGKSDNCQIILRFYLEEYFTTCSVDLSTATLGFKSNAELLGPTVLKITPEYNRTDEVNVQRLVVGFGGEEYECTSGNPLFITGLKPETSHLYHLRAVIKDSNGEYNYFFREKYYDSYNKKYFWRQDIPVNTGAVVLNTLSPKNTSSTTSIVCAETNIDDHETNVGFQWRKYDAPESLPSNKGYAAIYDGTMEDRIINLQPAFYYNVRAFYKSSDDTYYYGKWVTFDPSDFSYFEPTVHTYGVEGITHNTAQIRGYVMAGTDEIIQQGFEYYPVSDSNQSRRKVVDIETTAASGAPNIVFSSGQIMTATLEDLSPSTTYVCRAFATTLSGTVYGEDFKFTTSEFAGIYEIETEQNREPIGYFDLMGRRSERPHEGFNIVIYDDGTSEKFIQK